MKKIISCVSLLLCLSFVLAGCSGKRWKKFKYSLADFGLTENPVATVKFSTGDVVKFELEFDKAPNTCLNFIYLANSGFYDGLTVQRVAKNFMVQGGDPLANGTGGPGYAIPGEFTSNYYRNTLKHVRGAVSMSRNTEIPDSAGSQFFFMLRNSPDLDGVYAVFGKVTEGLEALDRIASVPVNSTNNPIETIYYETIEVDTYGVDMPEPETLKK